MRKRDLTREENIKRSQAGMREDNNDGIFAQHKHSFGLNSISFQDIDLGKPWRADEDPTHDCKANGCKIGRHYFKPTYPSRGALDDHG